MKKALIALTFLVAALGTEAAMAHGDVGVGIGIGRPHYGHGHYGHGGGWHHGRRW